MSATRLDHALLMARTVRHLRPAQVAHRVRLRSQKAVLARWPGPFERRWRQEPVGVVGWPEGFQPLDAQDSPGRQDPDELAQGRFCFVAQSRELGDPADWEQAGAEQLWRYHLHYFEWAWSLASQPDRAEARERFLALWRSWRDSTTFGRWDAWSPYVVSVRGWALCGLYGPLVRGSSSERTFLADLALYARFIRANLELDVGGNHLVKNLKALIGLAVFLDDERLERIATRHLATQLPVQVLSDGGHFERSPSYHCQVLGDLLDVRGLLAAAGRPSVSGLDDAVTRMQRWLGSMLMPDGDVPLFNDCTPVGANRLRLLMPPAAQRPRLEVLQESGYVICRPSDRVHLVIDVGLPCPWELPAHAHADCLSFELAVDGKRVVVDTGTSTYAPGPTRTHERSTRAHNTVEIDGRDQTEVWGAFRAARRARPVLERTCRTNEFTEISASHDGYRRLPGRPYHRRTLRMEHSRLDILDEISGGGSHSVSAFLHLAPHLDDAWIDEEGSVHAGPLVISTARGMAFALTGAGEGWWVASSFGNRIAARVVALSVRGELPLRLTLTIRW